MITDDGRPIAIGTPRRRALLGYLVWRANRAVSIDAITEALWGGAPPTTAQAQIRSDISALRRVLRSGSWGLESRPRGYVLVAQSRDADWLEFIDLFERAAATKNPAEAVSLLRAALGLWHGEAFSDLRAAFVGGARIFLNEQKLHAYELLAEVELRLGRHFELVAELSASVTQHPLRERLREHLMVALHRCGRTADALASIRGSRVGKAFGGSVS